MTLPPDFACVDCSGDEKAPSGGPHTAAGGSARPSYTNRLRRVIPGGSKVCGFLYLDFMRLPFCVRELSAAPRECGEESLISADLLGNRFTQIPRTGFPSNVGRAYF